MHISPRYRTSEVASKIKTSTSLEDGEKSNESSPQGPGLSHSNPIGDQIRKICLTPISFQPWIFNLAII
jgi:hypothetical protein